MFLPLVKCPFDAGLLIAILPTLFSLAAFRAWEAAVRRFDSPEGSLQNRVLP
jgi:hypothetical protein